MIDRLTTRGRSRAFTHPRVGSHRNRLPGLLVPPSLRKSFDVVGYGRHFFGGQIRIPAHLGTTYTQTDDPVQVAVERQAIALNGGEFVVTRRQITRRFLIPNDLSPPKAFDAMAPCTGTAIDPHPLVEHLLRDANTAQGLILLKAIVAAAKRQ
jgi:hypothetical protein